jgi:tetratricopeptide (TPR) repeat protein
VGVCLLLALAVLFVFGQTLRFGFVNLDDNLYVYDNPKVTAGLTAQGVAWVFTHAECNFYHPLTMISLMLDYQFHQLNAGGYHLTNILIHTTSAILLFLILRQTTGAFWRSAFVAAVFAIHPLRVESVAWVSERKDVLGTFFFVLTLGAYFRFVRQADSLGRYGLVVVLFAVGLLCKPTAVTLPFLLLLLDFWPLHRLAWPGTIRGFAIPRRLILEKIPLLAMAAAACVEAYVAQGTSVTSIAQLPLLARFGNVFISYAAYLRQTLWPAGLVVYYPYAEKGNLLWEGGLAFLLLSCITGAILSQGQKRPWLLVGWLWYLGMLVPMIGLVAVNPSAHGDRNTYLPQIGLAVALTWTVAEWAAGWPHRRAVLGGLMTLGIGALMLSARHQTSYWSDDETFWRYTLTRNPRSTLASYNLATALHDLGRLDESITLYQQTLEIEPSNVQAECNLGNALMETGQTQRAIECFHKVLAIQPNHPEALYNLGNALVTLGKLDEAVAQYRKAVESNPDYARAHFNLGTALAQKGALDEAIAHFQKAVEISPNYVEARFNLGNALFNSGRLDGAIAQYKSILELQPGHGGALANLAAADNRVGKPAEAIAAYRQVLQLQPDNLDALNSLAWALATSPQAALRDGAASLSLALKGSQMTGEKNPLLLRTLAAAYAETGNYGMATISARRAVALAEEKKNEALTVALQKEIKLYEADTPVRDVPP